MIYVPPIAVLLAVPVALLLANLLATVPAERAARLQPAEILRTE
jgi:ABC-type lipoprotein release transport system permease subunit